MKGVDPWCGRTLREGAAGRVSHTICRRLGRPQNFGREGEPARTNTNVTDPEHQGKRRTTCC